MRFAPAAAALSLVLAMTASMGQAEDREADPRAAALIAEGQAAFDGGQPQKAIDFLEAALVVDPGYTPIFIQLGEAARREGMQGKAIAYYREALERDPDNLAAVSGEGEALAEKGAIAKARVNLDRLKTLCGANCPETQKLAAAIARGPKQQTLRAEAVLPDAQVTQN